MRTLTIKFADCPRGVGRSKAYIDEQLKRTFDTDRKIEYEMSADKKSIVYYQEDHATMDDIMDRVARIEKLLNIT